MGLPEVLLGRQDDLEASLVLLNVGRVSNGEVKGVEDKLQVSLDQFLKQVLQLFIQSDG